MGRWLMRPECDGTWLLFQNINVQKTNFQSSCIFAVHSQDVNAMADAESRNRRHVVDDAADITACRPIGSKRRFDCISDGADDRFAEQERQIEEALLRITRLEETIEEQETALILAAKLPQLQKANDDTATHLVVAQNQIQTLKQEMLLDRDDCLKQIAHLEAIVVRRDEKIKNQRTQLAAHAKNHVLMREAISERDNIIKTLQGARSTDGVLKLTPALETIVRKRVRAEVNRLKEELRPKMEQEFSLRLSNQKNSERARIKASLEMEISKCMSAMAKIVEGDAVSMLSKEREHFGTMSITSSARETVADGESLPGRKICLKQNRSISSKLNPTADQEELVMRRTQDEVGLVEQRIISDHCKLNLSSLQQAHIYKYISNGAKQGTERAKTAKAAVANLKTSIMQSKRLSKTLTASNEGL